MNKQRNNRSLAWAGALVCLLMQSCISGKLASQPVRMSARHYQVPVLKEMESTSLLRVTLDIPADYPAARLRQVWLSFQGTTAYSDLAGVQVFSTNRDSAYPTAEKKVAAALFARFDHPVNGAELSLPGNLRLQKGLNYLWVSLSVKKQINLQHKVAVDLKALKVDDHHLTLASQPPVINRVGTALRIKMQDNVHTSRIPGLATAVNGDLLAIYDARYESARDLQGDIDIALNRSSDKGATWQPLQVVLDKGRWGNLPEKFNGISDPCILVDKNSGHIFIAGLWMYGVLDSAGKWTEGLTDSSKNWNHQWRAKGSQPGLEPKQTPQFLLTKSTDNGKTWSEPVDLTPQCKRPEWWLWAPAPGSGITMADGTLVFPSQGRDAAGNPFSNITYSRDGGKTWATSNPALAEATTECMVVQLTDGSLMLNMRTNANRGVIGAGNGRSVAITHDLGKTWVEHASSRRALPEPVCMASLLKHTYRQDGKQSSVLLFLNPHSYNRRDHITLQASFDDGKSWPVQKQLLLDELSGRGYSCITSIDEGTIGVVYESSQAELVFQQINLKEIIE